MHIRDPLHGTIDVTPEERAVIDSRFYQRLRQIKQMGFADLAFPGATHTRYVHGIGAMSVATRVFDAVYRQLTVPMVERRRLRQTVRLAMLLHDLGHPPLSHTSEGILPWRSQLPLPSWVGPSDDERASHEDMTLLLLLQSDLADIIRTNFRSMGIRPEHVASLICGRAPEGTEYFRILGVDHAPMLRQIISSELDADRMDYLLRDSFFTGVHYGRYDLDWIIQNITAGEQNASLMLALDRRAVLAFEDFLLSRYHMFLSVYYHSTSINYDRMLANYFATANEYTLSPDPEEYIYSDDIQLLGALRQSRNPWAQRIVARRGYSLVIELNPFEREVDLAPVRAALAAEGIDHFEAESLGVLSKYFLADEQQAPILVRTGPGTYARIEDYTPLFRRYAESARLVRLYVEPEKKERAREIAGPLART